MDQLYVTMLSIIGSVAASSGFWAFLQAHHDKHDARTELLVGLAHVRITDLSLEYLRRGYILKSEYDELYNYLYLPYHKAGGNGTAEALIHKVQEELKVYYSPEDVPKELIQND